MPLPFKNFSIEQFNHDVNASQDPAGNFRRWSGYRRQVGGFIERALAGRRGGRVIVLGAGALNDIDLPGLCDRFGQVVLSDIDTASIRQGIGRHGLEVAQFKKITVVSHDYTGARRQSFFPGLENLAQREAPAGAYVEYLEKAFAGLMPEPPPLGSKLDCVISCPVYTQMIFTQIEVFLKILYTYVQYPYEALNQILAAAHRLMPMLLGRYNDLMLSLLHADGLLVVLADVLEMDAKSPILHEIRRHLEPYSLEDDFIRQHLTENGLSLSLAGLADCRDKVAVCDSRYALWPFDNSRAFLVNILAGHPRLT